MAGEAKRRGDFEARKAQAIAKDQLIAEQVKRDFLKKFEGNSVDWSRLARMSVRINPVTSEV